MLGIMFNSRLFLPLLLVVVCIVGPASARVWRVPSDAADIRSGLALAQAGDTIQIAPGVYSEYDLDMVEGVVLRGDPDEPSAVVVDARFLGRVINCTDLTSASVVEGLTIKQGLASGGGMACFGSDVVVRRCVFLENLSTSDGGGMVFTDAAGLVEECTFLENGGGSGGAVTLRRSTTTMLRCSFRGNDADGWGGAVYVSGDGITAVLDKCEFLDNSAANGGAVAVIGAAPDILRSEFRRNAASASGGAFALSLGGEAVISDSRFEADTAPSGKTGLVGPGCSVLLSCTNADPSLVEGPGDVLWNDEGCEGVVSQPSSWSTLKAMFR